jgi:hypothetical protein
MWVAHRADTSWLHNPCKRCHVSNTLHLMSDINDKEPSLAFIVKLAYVVDLVGLPGNKQGLQ